MCCAATAEEMPTLAVLPLNHIGVAEAEARAITDLLEIGLVMTDAYVVIEQERIPEVLQSQQQSLADCTDDACAIEVGKLLSAELIVLGSISRIGSLFIINARIIDVRTAANVTAAKVESASLEGLAQEAELLAYKLAGLTHTEGGVEKVAAELGELFVQTTPDGAEVYVSGVRRATSPYLIPRVPAGTILVEARKGNLYAATEVNEWAFAAALAARGEGEAPDFEEARARLAGEIAAEANPALLRLRDAAAERGVCFLWDRRRASVGMGVGSRRWWVDDLPEPEEVAWDLRHDVPVAVVTGTNGKSTTVRATASILRAAGLLPGTCSTDGVLVASCAQEGLLRYRPRESA